MLQQQEPACHRAKDRQGRFIECRWWQQVSRRAGKSAATFQRIPCRDTAGEDSDLVTEIRRRIESRSMQASWIGAGIFAHAVTDGRRGYAKVNAAQPGSSGGLQMAAGSLTTTMITGLLLIIVTLVPVVLMRTALRNDIVNSEVGKYELTASAGATVGGWLTHFEFHDIEIRDAAGQVHCHIATLRSGRSLLGRLFSGADTETMTLVEPQLSIVLDNVGRLVLSAPPATDGGNRGFRIQAGTLTVRVPWQDFRPDPIDP